MHRAAGRPGRSPPRPERADHRSLERDAAVVPRPARRVGAVLGQHRPRDRRAARDAGAIRRGSDLEGRGRGRPDGGGSAAPGGYRGGGATLGEHQSGQAGGHGARAAAPGDAGVREGRDRAAGAAARGPSLGRGGGPAMTLSLFNTLTRKVEPFQPLAPPRVLLYTCGPTVWNYAHIGNFRTFLFEDLLRGHLEASNFDVF